MSEKKVLFRFVLVCCLVAALMVGGCGEDKAPPPQETRTNEIKTPEIPANCNIVLIVSDALRQDVLGCYGGEALTPNIDQLAARGVLFENAHSTSPWTPPSAVSIFTGSYATSYPHARYEKTIKIEVPDAEILLAEELRRRGYDTAIKNGNVQTTLHNCFQGLEPLFGPRLSADFDQAAKAAIKPIIKSRFVNHLHYMNTYHVLARLMKIPEGTNFFIAQWILDPHEPYRPLEKFEKKIVVDFSKLTQKKMEYTARKTIKDDPNEEEVKYLKARYLAEVESVDERVGYIMKILVHKNLMETTYFVFTSDHGELFGEHGAFSHGRYYYDELMRVPLIISGPGLPAGSRVETDVCLVDLMPTLKDLLGIEYNHSMQGESFKDLFFDDSAKKDPLYFDDVREHAMVDAVLERGFKLIAMEDGTNELYDLSRDAGELNNVADTHRDKVRAMLPKILAHRKANEHRLAANLLLLDGGEEELSEKEKKELKKKLKALGYVQ